jgi:hypothetical protein
VGRLVKRGGAAGQFPAGPGLRLAGQEPSLAGATDSNNLWTSGLLELWRRYRHDGDRVADAHDGELLDNWTLMSWVITWARRRH